MVDLTLIEQLRRMARRAALRAGMVLCERYTQPRKVKSKGPRDIVTDADSAAQLTAINAILERYPNHHFLAEEDIAAHPDEQGQWHIPSGIVWIIDPLDGTTNYAGKIPMVSVSVGVAIDGKPVAGAIYDPLREEMFEGAQGLGAMLNGRPLLPITQVPLDDAIICLDWAREPEKRSRAVASVTALAPACRTLRALGSAALGLAYLAAGRLQVYFHYGIQPWDCAAGVVIVQEVGGQFISPGGKPWQLGEMELLAGHPGLLEEIVPTLALVPGWGISSNEGQEPSAIRQLYHKAGWGYNDHITKYSMGGNAMTIEDRVQQAIEQILGDESLTDEMDDPEAQTLLDWGIGVARQLGEQTSGMDDVQAEESLETPLQNLRRVVRRTNKLIGGLPYSDAEVMAEDLAGIFELSAQVPGLAIPLPDNLAALVDNLMQLPPRDALERILLLLRPEVSNDP